MKKQSYHARNLRLLKSYESCFNPAIHENKKEKTISLETCTKRFSKKTCTISDLPSTVKIITVCSHSNYIYQGQNAELNTLWNTNLCIERWKKSEENPVQVLLHVN